jgi:hypothetical protein
MRIVLLFVPALLGTLFHLVPFVIVRAIAARVRPPGRTTVSLYLLTVGLPVYGLWYAACGWWMFNHLSTWFAAACLVVMPHLGILALAYWRGARQAASLAWHELRFLLRRDRLKQLRAERHELQGVLSALAADYESVDGIGTRRDTKTKAG